MNFVKLTAQHEFPTSDISDENAAIMELLMMNPDIIDNSHVSAEATRYLYRIGHAGLMNIATHKLDDSARVQAFSHGIKTYESMTSLIRPQVQSEDISEVTLRVLTAQQLLEDDFGGTLSDTSDKFHTDMPRTVSVIGESAARFSMDGSYALAGAAIARQLEIDALS